MAAFSRTRMDIPLKKGTPVARPPKPAPFVSKLTPYTPAAPATPAAAPAKKAAKSFAVKSTASSADRQQGQQRSTGALGKFDSKAKRIGSSRTTKAKGGMGLGTALKSDFTAAKSSIGGAIRSATKSLTGGKSKSSSTKSSSTKRK